MENVLDQGVLTSVEMLEKMREEEQAEAARMTSELNSQSDQIHNRV